MDISQALRNAWGSLPKNLRNARAIGLIAQALAEVPSEDLRGVTAAVVRKAIGLPGSGPLPEKRVTGDKLETAREMRKLGHTWDQVRQAVGISDDALRPFLRGVGIERLPAPTPTPGSKKLSTG